jgi:hypothetical protein
MNAWFAERDRRDDVDGYLDDVALARDVASAASLDAVARGLPAVCAVPKLCALLDLLVCARRSCASGSFTCL